MSDLSPKSIADLLFAFVGVATTHGDRWDEERWQRFVRLLDEVGRFAFGLPRHDSMESDVFGALDDIAGELEQTKGALVQTTTEARKVLYELHVALEPLLPGEDEEPEPVDPGSDTSPEPGQPGSEPVPLPPVEETPARVDREPIEPVARPSPRGSYTKPYTSKDIAAFYATHTKVQTAAEFGISVATVSRRVTEWERESGTKSRPDVPPHTPLRAAEAIEQSRDREQERVREAAEEIKAREHDLVSKNVAEMDEFMARRKANAATQANAAMEARRNAT